MAERPIDGLDELMDGGVRERFKAELEKVWDNVYDPNTDPEKAREIILRVKITPSAQRDAAKFKVDITSKLAPMESLQQTVLLTLTGNGQIIATERTAQVPGQIDIDGNITIPKTVSFETAQAKQQ